MVGLSVAVQQPYLCTAAEDRAVRIWHYEGHRTIVSTSMDDDVSDCALHPSGATLLLAMHDSCRLYNVAVVGDEGSRS